MPGTAKLLIVLGVLLILMGAALMLFRTVPRLPGDIYIERRGVTLYVPIVGSLILSVLLTVLLNLFFARR